MGKRDYWTPEPEIMLCKLESFVKKWKNPQDGVGRKVFTPKTIEATRKLKHHITTGCLSNIPAGGGTNRNECLHHQLNGFFTRSKMGVLLAYFLLTIILHAYNPTEKMHGYTVTKPINASKPIQSPSLAIEPIGIMPKVRDQSVQGKDLWEIDICH